MARRRVAVEEETKPTPVETTGDRSRYDVGEQIVGTGESLSQVRRVKVVWGQETLSPAKFHVCVVGPFELEADVLEGQDALTVIRRLQSELAKTAEEERERKMKSFIPNIVTQKG